MSRWDAHPFEPGDDPERCVVCGETRGQIRHHPTRVSAAEALQATRLGGNGASGHRLLALAVTALLVVLLGVHRACS